MTVEMAMQKQHTQKNQLHSVDWLTEIVRRACACRLAGKSVSAVDMKAHSRLEKVSPVHRMAEKRDRELNSPSALVEET